MKYGANCKFCHKPITLEIDDSYNAEHDSQKIIPLACCNWCADIRVERRILESKIARAARNVGLAGSNSQHIETLRCIIEKLTKDYAGLISRWHHTQGMAWHEDAVNIVMDKPDAWGAVLTTLWSLYRDWQKQGEPA